MRSRSRHGLPRLPRRRPRWQRIGATALRDIGWFAYALVWVFAGIVTALTIESGVNGPWRTIIALAIISAVVYGGLKVLPNMLLAIRLIVSRTASMIVQRWRWRRG